jgi:hypothetical protein
MTSILPSEMMDEYHSVSADGIFEDSFMDFPSMIDLQKKTTDESKDEVQKEEVEEEEGKVHVAKNVIAEEQVLLASDSMSAKETVKLEYDDLVQAYWKQVEIPTRARRKDCRRKKFWDVYGLGTSMSFSMPCTTTTNSTNTEGVADFAHVR